MERTTLDMLKRGESGMIGELEMGEPVRRRLIEMGMTPGTRVTVHGRAPVGDPIRILLRGYSLTLRAEDAKRITIRKENI